MKPVFGLTMIITILLSCHSEGNKQTATASQTVSVEGTWRLVSGTAIAKNDTTFTDYTKNQKMIKIINATHFSFIRHDLGGGKDSTTAVYESGGGKYTLTGNQYTEHLEYCSAREWEGHDFHFTVSVLNDTLIQQGVEKVEGAGIDRVITEKYASVKD